MGQLSTAPDTEQVFTLFTPHGALSTAPDTDQEFRKAQVAIFIAHLITKHLRD